MPDGKIKITGGSLKSRIINFKEGKADIELNEPQAGIAPGQACVFYQGERTLGGGWIDRSDS